VSKEFAIDEVTKIGITLIIGEDDELCPAATAQELADSLEPGVLREILILEGSHSAPGINNSAEVMDPIWNTINNCDGC
jgi:predicted esterase